MANLKSLFGNLFRTPPVKYLDDVALLPKYLSESDDYLRAIAPGGRNANNVINPYLGIPETTMHELWSRLTKDDIVREKAVIDHLDYLNKTIFNHN